MANQQKNTGNKRRKYRLLLKGEVVKELSGFLDTLIAVGILKYAEAKADFGMDYVTIRNVQQRGMPHLLPHWINLCGLWLII